GTQFKEARAWARRNAVSKQEHAFLRASGTRQRRTSLALVAVVLLILTTSGIASWFALHQPARPDYVTTTDEYVVGSLRWAVGNANTRDKITFDPNLAGKTIVLQNADIHLIQTNLTIEGPATGHITIQLIGVSLVLDRTASVTLSNLTFQENNLEDR